MSYLNVYFFRFNPIEFVFSQFKRNFKALRAKKLIGDLHVSHEELVVKAIEQLKK